MEHKSVLLNEILEYLAVDSNEVFVDMTLGGAGHTEAVVNSGIENLTVIGIDADHEAIERAEAKLSGKCKTIFVNTYFDSLDKILEKNQITSVNKVLFDLGYSSFEVDDPERGFSFLREGPLKMTYSQNPTPNQLTAHDVVNTFSEENLADIIYGFGEEGFSRRIAKAIVTKREEKEIKTTTELAEIISDSVPGFYRRGRTHPATKTFQAIRIAVNSELERLKIALRQAFDALAPKGRIAVISFHSLEDRIVKRYFKEKKDEGVARLLTKKPITPSEKEIKENPRSRSAKLRIIEKI